VHFVYLDGFSFQTARPFCEKTACFPEGITSGDAQFETIIGIRHRVSLLSQIPGCHKDSIVVNHRLHHKTPLCSAGCVNLMACGMAVNTVPTLTSPERVTTIRQLIGPYKMSNYGCI
jgi:hypothetical protein